MELLEYIEKLSQFPDDDHLFIENEIVKLDVDFIVEKLNEIFGWNNWKLSYSSERSDNVEILTCELSVKNVFDEWISYFNSIDISPSLSYITAFEETFRWAAADMGNIFGRQLKLQFDSRD